MREKAKRKIIYKMKKDEKPELSQLKPSHMLTTAENFGSRFQQCVRVIRPEKYPSPFSHA